MTTNETATTGIVAYIQKLLTRILGRGRRRVKSEAWRKAAIVRLTPVRPRDWENN